MVSKNKYSLYVIFSLVAFDAVLWIRFLRHDAAPDPAKWCGSDRIRIHKTALMKNLIFPSIGS